MEKFNEALFLLVSMYQYGTVGAEPYSTMQQCKQTLMSSSQLAKINGHDITYSCVAVEVKPYKGNNS